MEVPSGLNPTVIAEFENVLRIRRSQRDADHERGAGATLTYSLYRSCTSRCLWDTRAGGIRQTRASSR